MIVVGYLYNNNGMASWCIEAATALHFAGRDVILIKSKNIQLPKDFPAKSIDFDYDDWAVDKKKRAIVKKVASKIKKYYQLLPYVRVDDNFLFLVHQKLLDGFVNPTSYLLNQTSLVNKKVLVPQHVVAWAYKPFLKDYLIKAFYISKNFKNLLSNLHLAIHWHKIDWKGYTGATSVLAVSEKLTALLVDKGIPAYTVYPGTRVFGISNSNGGTFSQAIKLTVMSLFLEDKRKGLKKIICTLKKLHPWKFQLTLIGNCSEAFKEWVLENNFPAKFTGLLSREKAIEALDGCDVFLFGSIVDDWGFVQVEAMGKGMAVLSPNSSPFDEIVDRKDYLYNISNEADLERKLKGIILTGNYAIKQDKDWFKNRYNEMFSIKVFGENLLRIIG